MREAEAEYAEDLDSPQGHGLQLPPLLVLPLTDASHATSQGYETVKIKVMKKYRMEAAV